MARISPGPGQQIRVVFIPLSKICFDEFPGRQNSCHNSREQVIVIGNDLGMAKTDHKESDSLIVLH